jgi:hypothetical protein
MLRLLNLPQYRQNDTVQEFLALSISAPPGEFELEDAVPSTLSRKTAEELIGATATFIAASYYQCTSPEPFVLRI